MSSEFWWSKECINMRVEPGQVPTGVISPPNTHCDVHTERGRRCGRPSQQGGANTCDGYCRTYKARWPKLLLPVAWEAISHEHVLGQDSRDAGDAWRELDTLKNVDVLKARAAEHYSRATVHFRTYTEDATGVSAIVFDGDIEMPVATEAGQHLLVTLPTSEMAAAVKKTLDKVICYPRTISLETDDKIRLRIEFNPAETKIREYIVVGLVLLLCVGQVLSPHTSSIDAFYVLDNRNAPSDAVPARIRLGGLTAPWLNRVQPTIVS